MDESCYKKQWDMSSSPVEILSEQRSAMPSPLFMCLLVEESQPLFRWPFRRATETEPIPNPEEGHSELVTGKLKKRELVMETEIRTTAEPRPQFETLRCPG